MIIIKNVTPKSCHGCLRDCGARLRKVPYLRLFKIEKFLVFWRDGRLRELVAHEGSAVIN